MDRSLLKKIAIFSILPILGSTIIILAGAGQKPDHSLDQKEEKLRKEYHVLTPELPEKMTFAGENVPLNLFYVRESLDRELIVNTYFHSSTIMLFKRAHRYFPIIEPILKQNGIPEDFKYLALIESGLRNVVSPAGAAGYWQFLKTTGREYGLEVNKYIDERYNLVKATHAACEYLKDSYEIYGNWALVAAAYNAGKSRIKNVLESQKTDNYYELYLNTETGRYVYRILAIKLIFENPQDYGFFLRQSDFYPVIPTYTVNVDTTINDLVAFAHKFDISYRELKEFNPWLRAPQMPDKSRKLYTITLPQKGYTDYNDRLKKPKDKGDFFEGMK